jgi:hypothetical protein
MRCRSRHIGSGGDFRSSRDACNPGSRVTTGEAGGEGGGKGDQKAIAMATKDLSPEQRELQRKHQQLLEDISVRGLTTEEAAEYRRLKAKIDAAKWRGSTHQRR